MRNRYHRVSKVGGLFCTAHNRVISQRDLSEKKCVEKSCKYIAEIVASSWREEKEENEGDEGE